MVIGVTLCVKFLGLRHPAQCRHLRQSFCEATDIKPSIDDFSALCGNHSPLSGSMGETGLFPSSYCAHGSPGLLNGLHLLDLFSEPVMDILGGLVIQDHS